MNCKSNFQSPRTVIQKAMYCFLFLLFVGSAQGQRDDLDKRFQPIQDSIRTYLYQDNEKALGFAQTYLTQAEEISESFYIAKGLNFVGMTYYTKGENLSSIEYYVRSLKIFESIEDDWYSAVLLNNIGAAYIQRRKPQETIHYYQRALEKFKVLKDTLWIANVLNNLAVQQIDLGNHEEAIQSQQEALSIFEALQDEESAMIIKGNLASTLHHLNRNEEAILFANEFLSHPLAEKDLTQKANVLTTLSKIKSAQNKPLEALDLIEIAISLCIEKDMKQELSNALAQKATVKETLNDFPGALTAFKSFHTLYDTLYSKQKDERLTELMTQYEVGQKETSIALLQQEKIIALRNQWILGLGAALLTLIGLGIFILYRSRQRSILKLEEKNKTITKMLDEKEFLIKEIHHRVKNNLQIVSSLLQLQSRYLQEPNAIEALNDGESRVKSMAIIHHYLYTEDNLSKVDIQKYLDNLIQNLNTSYNIRNKPIAIHQEIDPVFLDVGVMIPLGLIVNELVTNIFKYAFEGRLSGSIWVKVKAVDDTLEVTIQDDGIGKDIHSAKSGFGTRMIEAFLRKLDAAMSLQVENGTHILISIPIPTLEDSKSKAS